MTKCYIENVGGSNLDTSISELMANDSRICEHPNMLCLDRRGNRIHRNLWEVPKEIAEKIQRMAKTSGFQFILYRCEGDRLPRDYMDFSIPVRTDPFREIRKARRKIGLSKVFKGSRLLGA